MGYVFLAVCAGLLGLLWFFARRAETKRLKEIGLLDSDALHRSDRAAVEGWSQQHRGHASGGWNGPSHGGPGI